MRPLEGLGAGTQVPRRGDAWHPMQRAKEATPAPRTPARSPAPLARHLSTTEHCWGESRFEGAPRASCGSPALIAPPTSAGSSYKVLEP